MENKAERKKQRKADNMFKDYIQRNYSRISTFINSDWSECSVCSGKCNDCYTITVTLRLCVHFKSWVGAEVKSLYQSLSDPGDLCSNFTRAGLFKQFVPSSNKQMIFFESGGFCYSAESCNRRFFPPSLRTNSAIDSEFSDQDVDPDDVWSKNKDQ